MPTKLVDHFEVVRLEKAQIHVACSTRREDLLLGPDLLQRVWLMRRMFIQMTTQQPQGAGMDNAVATEAIITRLDRARNNQEFLENLGRDD